MALVKDEMARQSITQRELGELVGVSQARVSQVLNGRENPSLAVVERYAAALGVTFALEQL